MKWTIGFTNKVCVEIRISYPNNLRDRDKSFGILPYLRALIRYIHGVKLHGTVPNEVEVQECVISGE